MAEIIRMPKLSDTMTEGVVAKWHKKVGDYVKEGELLAEIETDKATMEFESFNEGVLLYQGVEEGKGAPVDAILAIVGKKGEKIDDLINSSAEIKESTTKQETQATPNVSEKNIEKIDTSKINAKVVKMPKLSDTMTEGVVSKWHKKVGDKVAAGELLADIETDKATMEFESFEDGTLLYIGVNEGEKAPVDAVLAVIGEKGADVETLLKAEAQNSSKETPKEEKQPVVEQKESTVQETKIETPQKYGVAVKASPLAKKLAAERHINLSSVKGTGEGGRIVKRDIENYFTSGVSTHNLVEAYHEVDVSQMRKTIANRLSESKFSAPHFYLTISIDMDNLIETRKLINKVHDKKISFNDIIIKAAAVALEKHPKVNAAWLGTKIRYNKHVHVGVAVAVEEGLLVPVVRHANAKTLTNISDEVKDYVERAKAKKLQPEDWEGSTFTISNLGMFGIEEFTAIINPPNACIMAVGGINEVPVVRQGQIVPGNIMKVTLSCDHRVVDGALGAAYLKTFKQYMENPVLLLGSANI
ncbi:MAG: pyruvate dehydrogenase complex dihydrolipoamide acetyltransferase [Vicingaceae bacterium]